MSPELIRAVFGSFLIIYILHTLLETVLFSKAENFAPISKNGEPIKLQRCKFIPQHRHSRVIQAWNNETETDLENYVREGFKGDSDEFVYKGSNKYSGELQDWKFPEKNTDNSKYFSSQKRQVPPSTHGVPTDQYEQQFTGPIESNVASDMNVVMPDKWHYSNSNSQSIQGSSLDGYDSSIDGGYYAEY